MAAKYSTNARQNTLRRGDLRKGAAKTPKINPTLLGGGAILNKYSRRYSRPRRSPGMRPENFKKNDLKNNPGSCFSRHVRGGRQVRPKVGRFGSKLATLTEANQSLTKNGHPLVESGGRRVLQKYRPEHFRSDFHTPTAKLDPKLADLEQSLSNFSKLAEVGPNQLNFVRV